MCAAVSVGVLLRKEHASSSARTSNNQSQDVGAFLKRDSTSQPVNCPLLELLKRDLSGGGKFVEVQAAGVIVLFIDRTCKLLLLMIDGISSLGINAIGVLPNHYDD